MSDSYQIEMLWRCTRTRRESSYNIVFVDEDNDTYKYTPQSLAEFEGFPVGSSHRIKTNAVGHVEIAKENE